LPIVMYRDYSLKVLPIPAFIFLVVSDKVEANFVASIK